MSLAAVGNNAIVSVSLDREFRCRLKSNKLWPSVFSRQEFSNSPQKHPSAGVKIVRLTNHRNSEIPLTLGSGFPYITSSLAAANFSERNLQPTVRSNHQFVPINMFKTL